MESDSKNCTEGRIFSRPNVAENGGLLHASLKRQLRVVAQEGFDCTHPVCWSVHRRRRSNYFVELPSGVFPKLPLVCNMQSGVNDCQFLLNGERHSSLRVKAANKTQFQTRLRSMCSRFVPHLTVRAAPFAYFPICCAIRVILVKAQRTAQQGWLLATDGSPASCLYGFRPRLCTSSWP